MENNEQNNFEATNNVNPVNNVEPTPTVESTPEVKTEDTIMVAEPAARPAVEPTPAPVAPASQPMPAPEVSSRPEPVVETAPVEPTVEPKPVVIPKGEKPKGNNKGVVTLLLILILIVLAVCGYFVYDKYVKDLITKPSTNETSNNNQANNNVPEPTNDEGIFGELAVKNQKLEYEDSKSKSYTFDIYLDDKMVVEGLVYGEAGGNAGQISLNKMGYLKDTVIDAKYLAFFVKHAPGAHVPSTLFIIDKDGKIVFQRKGTSDGQYKIEETGEYAGGTTYKLDEDANRVLYYVISDSIEERSVQISSGSPVDETYKTYAKNTNTNDNNNQNNSSNVSSAFGLFDNDGKLLVSWNDLVNNYGLDIEKDYIDEFSSRELTSASAIFTKNNFTGKLVLPNTITKIGDYAFVYCDGLIEVVIPESVTVIGTGAFTGCKNLERAILPKNLTVLGAAAFNGCNKLKDIGSIPGGISEIYDITFNGCGLTEITIPGNIKKIGYSAFAFCNNLTTVTLLEGIETIGDTAFANCSNLSAVTIPKSVTTIVPEAFRNTKVPASVYSLNY